MPNYEILYAIRVKTFASCPKTLNDLVETSHNLTLINKASNSSHLSIEMVSMKEIEMSEEEKMWDEWYYTQIAKECMGG